MTAGNWNLTLASRLVMSSDRCLCGSDASRSGKRQGGALCGVLGRYEAIVRRLLEMKALADILGFLITSTMLAAPLLFAWHSVQNFNAAHFRRGEQLGEVVMQFPERSKKLE